MKRFLKGVIIAGIGIELVSLGISMVVASNRLYEVYEVTEF